MALMRQVMNELHLRPEDPRWTALARRSCRLPLRGRLQAMQEVGGALGVGCCLEGGPLATFQGGEPVGEIGCVILTRGKDSSSSAHRNAAPS